MTNKEAQITINAIKFMLDNAQYSEDVEEALNMAISALTNERTETHAFDLIDRQAAISLPVKPKEDRYFQTQNLDDAYEYGWCDLQGCIEKMPSAQPDISEYSDKLWRNAYERGKRDAQPETIRCKDCKYWNPYYAECEGIGNWFGFEGAWSENGYCYKAERREE